MACPDVNIPAAAFEIAVALSVLDDADGKATELMDKVGVELAKVFLQIEVLMNAPDVEERSELNLIKKLVERMRKIMGNLSPRCDQVGRCLDTQGESEETLWDEAVGLNNPWLQAQLRACRGDYRNRLTKVKALSEFGGAVHRFLAGGQFPQLPKLLGDHGIIDEEHVVESHALFERLNIASAAFAGNRDRWERVPLSLQPFFDAPRKPDEGDRYLQERMERVYSQAGDLDHLDGFGDVIDWKKLEKLVLADRLAEIGWTRAEYQAFMCQYIKAWPTIEDARAKVRRRQGDSAMVDMRLNRPTCKGNADVTEPMRSLSVEDAIIAGRAAQRIQSVARGREARLRVNASDVKVMRSMQPNVPGRNRAPMGVEQPARPGLLSDAAAHNLSIDPALQPFQAAGLVDALAEHEFPHGTGMNRWDVRPGNYARSVVDAGGTVAGAHSGGTAFTLFGLQLLTGPRHLDVAGVSPEAQAAKREYVYAVGLMAMSFMNFGAYHSFLETFPIADALAGDVPFFEGSVGPLFHGSAAQTYSSIADKIDEFCTNAGPKARAFLSIYHTAVEQPSLAPRALGGNAADLHSMILLSDAAKPAAPVGPARPKTEQQQGSAPAQQQPKTKKSGICSLM